NLKLLFNCKLQYAQTHFNTAVKDHGTDETLTADENLHNKPHDLSQSFTNASDRRQSLTQEFGSTAGKPRINSIENDSIDISEDQSFDDEDQEHLNERQNRLDRIRRAINENIRQTGRDFEI
ncbi:MAG: hypothetical protein WBA74_02205, partial [Cyclobacteriaceae bacterium]